MVQPGYPPARIDLLTSIDGVIFEDCFAHRLDVMIAGTLLPVISIDDLIRNKLATGRAKDLVDVESLRTVGSPQNYGQQKSRGFPAFLRVFSASELRCFFAFFAEFLALFAVQFFLVGFERALF